MGERIYLAGAPGRGPINTELMGISIALPISQTRDEDTKKPWDEETWRDFLREAQPQMLDRLRAAVGGARPHTEPQMSVDGPHPDPIQGPIYVMTAAAWFDPRDLSDACPAARARAEQRGERS